MQSCDPSAASSLLCSRILLSIIMGLHNGCFGCWAGFVLLISLRVPSHHGLGVSTLPTTPEAVFGGVIAYVGVVWCIVPPPPPS